MGSFGALTGNTRISSVRWWRCWLTVLLTVLTALSVGSAASATGRLALAVTPSSHMGAAEARCAHAGQAGEGRRSNTNPYTYVNGNPINLSDPDGHGAVDAYGNQVPLCVYNSSACSPAASAHAHKFYSHRLRSEEADASAGTHAPAPPPASNCPVYSWICGSASAFGSGLQNTGQWMQQNSQTLLQMSAHTGELALGTLGEVAGGTADAACGVGEVITLGLATEVAVPCVAGGTALAVGGFALSMHAANSLAEDSGRLHSVEHDTGTGPSEPTSVSRGTAHEPASGSEVRQSTGSGPSGEPGSAPNPTTSTLQTVVNETRDTLVADPRLAEQVLSPAEMNATMENPWLTRMSFGKAVERMVGRDPRISDLLQPLGGPNNPDFIDSGGLGYEVTTSNQATMDLHLARDYVDESRLATYEPISNAFRFDFQ